MKQKILGLLAQGKIGVAATILANSVGTGKVSDQEFKILNKEIKNAASNGGSNTQNFPPPRGKKKGCNIPNGDGHW
ncbi:hypothetical protein KJ991_01065 [Patescibacteria group bacterium]|nr:hypothetical protein [Patescibacteria group bacterium]MBU4057710.1 hypothetical protein [Patescibacteria group bacterium]MBU4115894.1 hypothetical protein [Patescibacteria group bacterium]